MNTFVPGLVELATRHEVFIGGDDFKSGQTKIKSVLVDFLVSSGIKPVSIVSYNHLGNNDGKNLSSQAQFRSKEISKSNVVDDMVASNGLMYDLANDEHPDHTVVIKYAPTSRTASVLSTNTLGDLPWWAQHHQHAQYLRGLTPGGAADHGPHHPTRSASASR